MAALADPGEGVPWPHGQTGSEPRDGMSTMDVIDTIEAEVHVDQWDAGRREYYGTEIDGWAMNVSTTFVATATAEAWTQWAQETTSMGSGGVMLDSGQYALTVNGDAGIPLVTLDFDVASGEWSLVDGR